MPGDIREVRYFLEGVCCDLARFEHVTRDGAAPEDVRIRQEMFLAPEAYADIHVQPSVGAPYFVEVKYGYPAERALHHLARKYSSGHPALATAGKIILVLDDDLAREWSLRDDDLKRALPPHLQTEIWSTTTVVARLRSTFGTAITSLDETNLVDIQMAIDTAKGEYAFGSSFRNDPLQSSLLWHFGFWKVRNLLASRRSPRDILSPGLYRDAIAIFADLSSFSSYVRDTRDDRVVRNALTSFYAKSRYQVLNSGGMMYQFLGDGVVALFGVPEDEPTSASNALECACALLDIGSSVSTDWQRQIDYVQPASGAHIGIAVGDLNIVSLRPFSRAHIGAVADSINTAARLSAIARSDEIMVTNSFFQRLPQEAKDRFAQTSPVEARNIGRIQTWVTRADNG